MRADFILLSEQPLPQQLAWWCEQVAQLWRQHRTLRVWCSDQIAAEQFDEYLWQQPVDAFIPHNLCGEGPPGGTPVEICWPQCKQLQPRGVAAHVNLAADIPLHLKGARFVLDRVPTSEPDKQQARERYKKYRALGFELQTISPTN